jgi:hypothetical protein
VNEDAGPVRTTAETSGWPAVDLPPDLDELAVHDRVRRECYGFLRLACERQASKLAGQGTRAATITEIIATRPPRLHRRVTKSHNLVWALPGEPRAFMLGACFGSFDRATPSGSAR